MKIKVIDFINKEVTVRLDSYNGGPAEKEDYPMKAILMKVLSPDKYNSCKACSFL
jgi:hypothetical protein